MLSFASRSHSAPLSSASAPSLATMEQVARSTSESKLTKPPTRPTYTLQRELSKSIYGQVYLAKQKPSNARCVIKLSSLKMLKEHVSSEDPQEEVRIMDFLSRNPHPNIIQHVENFIAQDHLYHVMEYFPGQDFFDFIRDTKSGLVEQDAKLLFKQLISAVKHLHKQDVVHLDLSPENLLINPNTLQLKIIDFGAALILPPQNSTAIGNRGKASYVAPEAYAGHKFDAKSADIYSCGTLLFVMLFAAPAYTKPVESDENFMLMMSKKYNVASFPYKKVSESVVSLLKLIIAPAKKRCSLSDIENHLWMK